MLILGLFYTFLGGFYANNKVTILPSQQNENSVLIEKKIYLKTPYKHNDKIWYNEVVEIDIASEIKNKRDSVKIESLTDWVGIGELSLQKYQEKQKTLEAELNIKTSPLEAYTNALLDSISGNEDKRKIEVFVLRARQNTEDKDCKESFLHGGFLIYRMSSDCYPYIEQHQGIGFGKTKQLSNARVYYPVKADRMYIGIRSFEKIDEPIYLKVLVKIERK